MQGILLLVYALILGASALDPITDGIVQSMVSMMDTTVNPCEDFYQYACGAFIKNNPPPNTTNPYIYIPSITGISYSNDKTLSEIVQEPYPLINDLYESCMAPPSSYAGSAKSMFEVVNFTIYDADLATGFAFLLSNLKGHGVDAFYSYEISYNESNPQQNLVFLVPSGYFEGSPDVNMTEYINMIIELETFLGVDPSTAKQDAATIVKIEQWISTFQNSTQLLVNYSALNSFGFDFETVNEFMGVNWDPTDLIYVVEPSYFQALNSTIATFSEDDIKVYLRWRAILYIESLDPSVCWSADLSPEEAQQACYFVSSYYPNPPPYTQDVVCRYLVYNYLGDYVGLIFSNVIVNDDVSSDIREMTTGIQKAFGQSLYNLTWLDQTSLSSVIFKLNNIIQIIGHPNSLDKYEGLLMNSNLFSNLWDISGVVNVYTFDNVFLPFNRSDYQFPPFIVNAFYSPETNTINFPAGILESPMFSATWPKLFQYSRLGYVVGHENTHGFDNQGSQFNAYGVPGDILDTNTTNNFNNNAQCIVDYYSQFIAYANVSVNGQQTLPENIADIGGVKNSYRAYQNWVAANGAEFQDGELIQGLTTNQVFFLHLGQTWCTSENDAYLAFEVKVDVHSPSKWRVIGPLSQFNEFASVWNCPASSPMNPANRCNLW